MESRGSKIYRINGARAAITSFWDYLRRHRVRILMYHSIANEPRDRLAISPSSFAAQMQYLADGQFNVISLAAACQLLRTGRTLSKAIVLTFDDGFRNFLTNAAPILQEHGFPATVFIVTKIPEDDARPRLSANDWRTVQRKGFALGSHTVTHPDLTSVDELALARELECSQQALGALGETFFPFAYPGGKFTRRERDAVRRTGYDCAVIVGGRWGNGPETDRFLLKREPMLASDSLAWFKKRVNGYYEAYYLLARARGIDTR